MELLNFKQRRQNCRRSLFCACPVKSLIAVVGDPGRCQKLALLMTLLLSAPVCWSSLWETVCQSDSSFPCRSFPVSSPWAGQAVPHCMAAVPRGNSGAGLRAALASWAEPRCSGSIALVHEFCPGPSASSKTAPQLLLSAHPFPVPSSEASGPLACIFLLEPLSFKIEQLSPFRKEFIPSNLGQFDSTAIHAALFGSTIAFPAWCHIAMIAGNEVTSGLRMCLGHGFQPGLLAAVTSMIPRLNSANASQPPRPSLAPHGLSRWRSLPFCGSM